MNSALQILFKSFDPLRNRNFRVYLGGQALSLIGTWLQMTAQSWVVWQLSHSNQALGIVGMLGSLPILLLGPWAGVWADRLDRRKLLVGTQVTAMCLAFALAALVQTGLVQLWHVYVLSTLLGVVTALDMPTQQAFLGDLSGIGAVRKAVVLNAMIIQISRMVGPAVAGTVIQAFGVAVAFWVNGLSFLAVIASLLIVRAHQEHHPHSGHVLGELREGLGFIANNARVLDLIIFAAIITFFGIPIMTVMPAIATEVLHGDAQTLGLLMASSGAGALVGAIVVAPLAHARRRIGLVLGGITLWLAAWLMLFSFSTWLPLSMATLFAGSIGFPAALTTINGLLQVMAPPKMRARLLSTYIVVSFGVQPIAALAVGFSADRFGPAESILFNGIGMFTCVVLLLVARPELRRWEAAHQAAAPETPGLSEI
jgi:MFS family permease